MFTLMKSKPADREAAARPSARIATPRVDIHETADAFVVVADMPGVDQSGVEVTVDRGLLTIKGTAKREQTSGYTALYSEYVAADYERSFSLPETIERDGVEAAIANGVLRVTLPKSQAALPRKIEVKAG